MVDIPDPNLDDESNSSFFINPDQLVTHEHRILQAEFEGLTILNEAEIRDFDPHGQIDNVDIALQTTFPEYEESEKKISEAMRSRMLHNLGLSFEFLPSEDPDNLFQYTYRDGEIHQIRLMSLKNGIKTPVHTSLGKASDGSPIERVSLLSFNGAEELKARFESYLDEHKVNERLKRQFDLDDDFLKLSGLTFEDKQAMLAAFDEIQALEVIRPDLKELDKIREKFARSMIPSTGFMEAIFANQEDKIMEEYERQFSELVGRSHMDKKSRKELAYSERLLRLSALERQLKIRRRNVKLGAAVTTIVVTLFGAGTGAVAGVMMITEAGQDMSSFPAVQAAIGGVIGGGAGLSIGLEGVVRVRRRAKYTSSGFLPIADSAEESKGSLRKQFQHERRLAKSYLVLLSSN